MKKCKSCGKAWPDEAAVCADCGGNTEPLAVSDEKGDTSVSSGKKGGRAPIIILSCIAALLAIALAAMIAVFVLSKQPQPRPPQLDTPPSAAPQQPSTEPQPLEPEPPEEPQPPEEQPGEPLPEPPAEEPGEGDELTVGEETPAVYSLTESDNSFTYTPPREGRTGFVVKGTGSEVYEISLTSEGDNAVAYSADNTACAILAEGQTVLVTVQGIGPTGVTVTVTAQKPAIDITRASAVYDRTTFKFQRNRYLFTASQTGLYKIALTGTRGISYNIGIYSEAAQSPLAEEYGTEAYADFEAGKTYIIHVLEYEGTGSYTLEISK